MPRSTILSALLGLAFLLAGPAAMGGEPQAKPSKAAGKPSLTYYYFDG